MRLLIPDGKIETAARASGLSTSLIYQERRPHGDELNKTGTRNTIDRLDIFCDLALSWNKEAVALVAERYAAKHQNAIVAPENVTVATLLDVLGKVSKETGEAIAALASRQSINRCAVEVAQAKEIFELALRIVAALETQV